MPRALFVWSGMTTACLCSSVYVCVCMSLCMPRIASWTKALGRESVCLASIPIKLQFIVLFGAIKLYYVYTSISICVVA